MVTVSACNSGGVGGDGDTGERQRWRLDPILVKVFTSGNCSEVISDISECGDDGSGSGDEKRY